MTVQPTGAPTPAPPQPARERMSLSTLLAVLAGAHPEVLRKAPTERVKHAAMGGVLLTTAGVAAVSASFALATAVGVPVVAAVIAGALWGFVIFNLDRMLTVSMTRHSGWWRNLVSVVPRVALAVVIGAVISVPLVLQIFRPEIEAQLAVQHVDLENQAVANQLGPQDANIAALQKQFDHLQDVVAGRSTDAVSSDPDVVAAQKKVDAAQAAYDKAASDAQCELVGSCGTHTPGVGLAYRQAQALAEQALAELQTDQRQLADTTAAAQTRISNGATTSREAAQAELAKLGPQLDAAKAKRSNDQAAINSGQGQSNGLLARLQALDALSAKSPSMGQARQALFLLFLLIEVLPVLVKLLTLIGKPSLYDRILVGDEDLMETRAGNERNVATQLEQHRMDEQVRLGKIANTQLVNTQAAIAKRAIDVWGQVAMSRSDDELARWYGRYTGRPLPQGPSLIKGTQQAVPTVQLPTPPAQPPTPSTQPPMPPTQAPAQPTQAPAGPQPAGAAAVPAQRPTPTPTGPAAPTGNAGPQTYQQFRAQVGVPANNGHHPDTPSINP